MLKNLLKTQVKSGKFMKYSKMDSMSGGNPHADNLHLKFPLSPNDTITYRIYKYDPSIDEQPYVKTYFIKKSEQDPMLLSNLIKIKDEKDDTLAFRRSCREGLFFIFKKKKRNLWFLCNEH
jgi:hypothetical protein